MSDDIHFDEKELRSAILGLVGARADVRYLLSALAAAEERERQLRVEADTFKQTARFHADKAKQLRGALERANKRFEADARQKEAALEEIVDRHLRPCGVHEAPLPCDVALAETYGLALAALGRA